MIDRQQILVQFALWCLEQGRSYGGCDIDGGDLQDKAEELGILVRAPVTEPCGDNCHCAEYTDEWPTKCLRLAPWVKEPANG